jgi:hypothetical protein
MNRRRLPRPRHLSFRSLGWLAVLAMVALSVVSPLSVAANGNNGTLKIHGWGTPAGTMNNDPKVCVFNVEGFNFDSGQTGYIKFDVQGGDAPHVIPEGPFDWGPANAQGRYDTEYYSLKPGHYKATLYGKTVGRNGQTQIDVKAKSKVFKVECVEATPTPTPETNPTPKPTPKPTPTPTPTPGGGEGAATPTPTPKATPTPHGGVSGATGTPHLTLPPTDTGIASAAPEGSDSWRIVLLGLAALLAAVLVVTPGRSSIRRR